MAANLIKITGGTTYNLVLTDEQLKARNLKVRLLCKTLAGAITINLPKISTLGSSLDVEIIVDDFENNAGANNITVNCNAADTIQNNATQLIKANGTIASITISSRNEWGYAVFA